MEHGEVMSPPFVDMKGLFSTECLHVGLRVSGMETPCPRQENKHFTTK